MMDCGGGGALDGIKSSPAVTLALRGITRGGEPGRPYEDAVRMRDTTGSATVPGRGRSDIEATPRFRRTCPARRDAQRLLPKMLPKWREKE
jgi:hypothetical protein